MTINELVTLATWRDAERMEYLTKLLIRISQMDTADLARMASPFS